MDVINTGKKKTKMEWLINIISNIYLKEAMALLSLITAIASEKLVIKIPAIIILFFFVISLRALIWRIIKDFTLWVNKKFVFGVIFGIIIGIIIYPVCKNILDIGISSIVPKIEIVSIVPQNEETLKNLYDSVEIRFSEKVPKFYWNFIRVEISPSIKFKKTWIYDTDPSEGFQILYIESARYHGTDSYPKFEPDKIYELNVYGLLVKNPTKIKFLTPSLKM